MIAHSKFLTEIGSSTEIGMQQVLETSSSSRVNTSSLNRVMIICICTLMKIGAVHKVQMLA